MIRVEIVPAPDAYPGRLAHPPSSPDGVETWTWRATLHHDVLEGRSHQPLLDACRRLKRAGAALMMEVGVFLPGREDWTLKTTVGYGATQIVHENNRSFTKYKPRTYFGPSTGVDAGGGEVEG
jgi:hypothetical protein